MLELKNITKDYDVGGQAVHALRGVSLKFRKSEFVSILGPSGCGKTTLLNIIGGLDRYTSGDLIIDGVSTKKYRDHDWDAYRNHSIGFVFQSYNLIPHQSVLANVELALTLSGVSKKERRTRAKEALERVGLGDQINKRPNQLSGGQMQRVAIARALVNNPSILLADEPTGALDSETSLQVMELLKEIAHDRLVVMVTHNPELAATYSTRIIRLLDGKVIDDSSPYEEALETDAPRKKVRKPSMSFLTALSLSFNNLMTKKARTILISFAGSIGIIGIALILSMSNGVQTLIDRMERETLSSYPLILEKTTVDMSSMISMEHDLLPDDVVYDDDHVYSVNVMTSIMDTMISGAKTNNLADFKTFLESGESEIDTLISDISYSYSTPMTVYHMNDAGKYVQVHPNALLTDMGVMPETSGTGLMSPGTMNVWARLTNNETLLESQYDVVEGRMPESYNEVVLIVTEDNRISDFTLYSLGLLDATQLKESLMAASRGEEYEIDTEMQIYSCSELVGLKFKLLTNTDVFTKDGDLWVDRSEDEAYMLSVLGASEDVTVVGVIRPAEDATTASGYGSIGYRDDLMEHLVNKVNASQIVLEQKETPDIDVFTGLPFAAEEEERVYTMEELNAVIPTLPEAQQAEILGYVQQMQAAGQDDTTIATQLMNAMFHQSAGGTYEENLTKLGVADLDEPDTISIYPIDFEAKDQIEDIIRSYNNGLEEAEQLTYTDYIGLMISSITTIINAVSYVLIAFVAVSLVVSSIMIGIITYISVLERTREIGVLRAIGASKRDISNVFNAETVTIGFGAGIMGIGITLLLIIPINAIIEHLTGLSNVAVLPTGGALILIGISVLLTFIAGLFPARIASKKDPVIALRTE